MLHGMFCQNSRNLFMSSEHTTVCDDLCFPTIYLLPAQYTKQDSDRPVASGGALALPVFGQTVNCISTRGQIMPTTVLQAPPDFQTLRRS